MPWVSETNLNKWRRVGLLATALICGCATVAEQAAPGAGAVRLARNAADVANCTAVGNVKAYVNNVSPGVGDEVKFRNQVVGYGGNAAFVTVYAAYETPAEGVAYRCPASP